MFILRVATIRSYYIKEGLVIGRGGLVSLESLITFWVIVLEAISQCQNHHLCGPRVGANVITTSTSVIFSQSLTY